MAENTLKDKCAIVGIGQTKFDPVPKRDRLELALEAIKNAVADAGLKISDIDGIVRYTIDGSANDQILVNNLGMKDLAFSAEIPFYGGSGCATVATAAAAVAAGLANYVVCYRSCTPYDFMDFTKRNSSTIWAIEAGVADFMRPYGWLSMMDTYGLIFEAHSAKYGTTVDQLGAIAVAIRKCANRNPNAVLHDVPLTIEGHRKSAIVSGRITVDDVVLPVGSAAGAVIVTSADNAKRLKQRPAYIMAAASGLGPEPNLIWEMRVLRSDVTESTAKWVAPRLFKMAGIKPKDINVAEFYDCATSNVLMQIEDYGFCKKGEAGSFAENGNLELGGTLPITTSGGFLAEVALHGFNHVLEGVRQIRGTSYSQVKDAEFVMVTSSIPTPTSAIILRRK
ncbi:MAG: lipid-transfer protein [Dehalococcoidia bacterium]|jgi:acetyl-CoA acetyltransferase